MLLVIGLIFEAIAIVQSFTKNIPMDWSSAGVFFVVLTVAMSSAEKKEKEIGEKKGNENCKIELDE